MGKVKIKRKSTLIDMTAMSDVTVLLLTFFMLTSTFLQKEPTVVYTPSSVSEEKVPVKDLVTILVSSEDKSGKLKDPTSIEGKIFISFAGDSVIPSETLREKVLVYAVDKYNKLHQKNPITLTNEQIAAFKKTNMLGVPFRVLPEVLSMETSKRDKLMSDLTNENVGIPINDNKQKDGALNDFQIWMYALANVAQDGRNEKLDQLAAEGKEDEIRDADILYNSVFQGRAISVKADKDTPLTTINRVFDNLQTMGLNKFTLMTALKSESAE